MKNRPIEFFKEFADAKLIEEHKHFKELLETHTAEYRQPATDYTLDRLANTRTKISDVLNRLAELEKEIEKSYLVRFDYQHKLREKIHELTSSGLMPDEIDRSELVGLFKLYLESENQIKKTSNGLNRVDVYKQALVPSPKGIPLPKDWFGDDVYDHNLLLMPGLPTIVGGFTGIGKTTLSVNMTYYYYEVKKKQVFISLEMPGRDILYKLLRIGITRKKYQEINRIWDNGVLEDFIINEGKKHEGEMLRLHGKYKALLEDLSKNIVFYDNSGTHPATLEAIREELEYLNMSGNIPDIIYIDYAQIVYMADSQSKLMDRRNQVIQVIAELTQLTKVYKFALVLISQTNRSDTSSNSYETVDGSMFYHAPSVFSMSESSSIEINAGLVLTVGREWGKNGEDRLHISVAKNRHGKTHLSYMVKMQKSTQALLELDEQDNEIPEKNKKEGKNKS